MHKKDGKKRDYLTYLFFFFFYFFAAASSYVFGFKCDFVQRFERFLFVDKLEENNFSNYLHGILKTYNGYQMTYSDARSLQLPSRYKGPSYFMVGEHEPVSFITSFSDLSDFCISLGSVSAYSDKSLMETIPLPLYKDIGFAFSPQSDGTIPCYISNEMAYAIIGASGDYQSLEDFFESKFIFDIFENGEFVASLKVVNIYLVNNDSSDWPTDKYDQYCSEYLNYNSHFYNCHKNFVFIPTSTFYLKYGTSFYFDLKNNFGYIRNYYSQILGYNFANQGYDPHIFLTEESGNLLDITGKVGINVFCNSTSILNKENLPWLLTIISSSTCLFASLFLINKKIMNSSRPLLLCCVFSFLPFFIFQIVCQLIHIFFFDLDFNLAINAFGNAIFFILSLITFLFFFACYMKKGKKC